MFCLFFDISDTSCHSNNNNYYYIYYNRSLSGCKAAPVFIFDEKRWFEHFGIKLPVALKEETVNVMLK